MTIDVQALVAKAREQIEQVEPTKQEILLAGQLVTMHIRPLSGQEWRALVVQHPPRVEEVDDKKVVIAADRPYGFNIDSLVPEYPRLAIADGDNEIELSQDEWREIVAVLADPSLEAMRLAIWGLNVYEPAMEIQGAGKASKGEPKKKRRSPESSA